MGNYTHDELMINNGDSPSSNVVTTLRTDIRVATTVMIYLLSTIVTFCRLTSTRRATA
jgi:hypothetical protein